MAEEPDNIETGYSAGLWIGGRPVTHVISATAEGTLVRLQGGGSALLPAGHPDTTRATALPAEQLVTAVPAQVTNAQARAALREAKLLDTVQSAIEAHPDPAVRDAWEYSPFLSRDSALVASLGMALQLSVEDIDGLFIAAAAVEF